MRFKYEKRVLDTFHSSFIKMAEELGIKTFHDDFVKIIEINGNHCLVDFDDTLGGRMITPKKIEWTKRH